MRFRELITENNPLPIGAAAGQVWDGRQPEEAIYIPPNDPTPKNPALSPKKGSLDGHRDPMIPAPLNPIVEGMESVLYHYTSAFSVVKILTDNQIALTAAVGADIQSGIPHTYFLSATRSKIGDYTQVHDTGTSGVVLVLNRDWLAQHRLIKPVDYWGPEYRKIKPTKNEMEDRVFSHDPYIPLPAPPKILIMEMHLLVSADTDERYRASLLGLITMAKRKVIPLFAYQDGRAWLLQDKRRAVPLSGIIEQLRGLERQDGYRSQYKTSSRFGGYMELIAVPVEARSQLSERAKSLLRGLAPYYLADAYRQIEAEIHNARSPNSPAYPQLVKFITFMRSNRLSPRTLIDQLSQKWYA